MSVYVYVAGPISSDPLGHTRTALEAAAKLMDAGLFPFVPHLSCFWQVVHPREYEQWMRWDFAWIRRCDVLLRLPGHSPGADREVALARELGKPVYTSLADLLAAAGREGART